MDGDVSIRPLRDLPALPASLIEVVAINVDEGKVFVEQVSYGKPLFLSWLDAARTRGFDLIPEVADLDQIGRLRQRGEESEREVADEVAVSRENIDAALEIIRKGAGFGASDIDLLRRADHAEVRYKIKGRWRVARRVKRSEGDAIDRAIMQSIATTTDAQYLPLSEQDAEISGKVVEALGLTSIRIVRGPAAPYGALGGHMTMRLQYPEVGGPVQRVRKGEPLEMPRRPAPVNFEAMGYTARQADRLAFLTEGTSGNVLLTGPMGSGKSSIMFKMLQKSAHRSPDLKQVTMERPIEFPLPWGVQLAVVGNFPDAESEGLAFQQKMRTVLRMAPDTILVGEIRTAGVALVFFEAGRLGHKGYGSIHVDDPYQVVERIELWDNTRLNRRTFCDHKLLRGIVNQRLVPMLCPRCSLKLREAPEGYIHDGLQARLRTYGNLDAVRVKGEGCPDCDYDGVAGRKAAAEIVVCDEDLMNDFLEGSRVARAKYRAREGADRPVMWTAMEHVLAGRADPVDVNELVDVIPAAAEMGK